jgi:hypothetical protein
VPGKYSPNLWKGNRHDAIGGVESLLDAVSVVDVDVDVEHALVRLEELEDREDDVVDVAKARGFVLLGVVQAPRPVDDGVRLLVVELDRAAHGPAGVDLAEVEEAVEDGAILGAVEALELPHVLVLVIGGDEAEELDVLVAVELGHVLGGRERRAEHLHSGIDEGVRTSAVGSCFVDRARIVGRVSGWSKIRSGEIERVGFALI